MKKIPWRVLTHAIFCFISFSDMIRYCQSTIENCDRFILMYTEKLIRECPFLFDTPYVTKMNNKIGLGICSIRNQDTLYANNLRILHIKQEFTMLYPNLKNVRILHCDVLNNFMMQSMPNIEELCCKRTFLSVLQFDQLKKLHVDESPNLNWNKLSSTLEELKSNQLDCVPYYVTLKSFYNEYFDEKRFVNDKWCAKLEHLHVFCIHNKSLTTMKLTQLSIVHSNQLKINKFIQKLTLGSAHKNATGSIDFQDASNLNHLIVYGQEIMIYNESSLYSLYIMEFYRSLYCFSAQQVICDTLKLTNSHNIQYLTLKNVHSHVYFDLCSFHSLKQITCINCFIPFFLNIPQNVRIHIANCTNLSAIFKFSHLTCGVYSEYLKLKKYCDIKFIC